MKKNIIVRLTAIILACMLCSLYLNYFWRIRVRDKLLDDETDGLFQRIELIAQNAGSADVQAKRPVDADANDANTDNLIQARAAARIIGYDPDIMDSNESVNELAQQLEVKELHIFNTDGKLIAGTRSDCFGINLEDDAKLAPFRPILEDRSLEVSAEVNPGIGGQEPMKYSAAWVNDNWYIVFVGVEIKAEAEAEADIPPEPEKQDGLPYAISIFSNMMGSDIFAVDPGSYNITASTMPEMAGKNISELGCDPVSISGEGGHTTLNVDGEKCRGIYKNAGSLIMIRAITESALYGDIKRNYLVFMMLLILLSGLIIIVVERFLNKHIIRNILDINHQLVQITQGDLDATLPKSGTPEFAELCTHINEMVDSLLDMTRKMSLVFDEAELPICVYEFGPGMKRVMATNRLPEILHIARDEATAILSDSEMFLRKLDEIEQHPIYPGSKIFRLPGMKNNYVRMETFFSDRYLMGVLVDETKSILERQLIERERDIDPLTDLYSRRAFSSRVKELLEDSGTLGSALLMMADADGLKDVNDQHGHESGDRYLQAVADILRGCRAKHFVVGRRSGDEFVVFIYGCSGIEELNNYVAMLLRQRDLLPVVLNDGARVNVRFSVGMAYYPIDGQDFDTLLHIADERMYMEKRQRKAGR